MSKGSKNLQTDAMIMRMLVVIFLAESEIYNPIAVASDKYTGVNQIEAVIIDRLMLIISNSASHRCKSSQEIVVNIMAMKREIPLFETA